MSQSQISVVQYVPDLARAERINIGVLAFSGAAVRIRFLKKWTRVKSFGGDVRFARDFAKTAEQMRERVVDWLNENWQESIQFTKPVGCLMDVDDALEFAAKRFLIEPPQRPAARRRGRKTAVVIANRQLERSLRYSFGDFAKQLLQRNYKIEGRFESDHRFDLAVANGRPYCAVGCLSFEVKADEQLEKAVDALKWNVDDVRQKSPDLELAVMVLPPKQQSELFDHTVHTLGSLNATVLEETDFAGWAEQFTSKIAQELPGSYRDLGG